MTMEPNCNLLESFVKSFHSEKISDKDLEEFGQRVFSFIEGQKWVSRPLVLSPSICARYGWKCVNSNLLECVACGAKLCTQEPKIEVYDAYKSCLDKIVSDLKEGHKADCPWPLAPSPESFVKMVPLPKEEALNQFINRLKACLDFKCFIPVGENSVLSELGLKQEDVSSLCKLVEVTPTDVNLIGKSAVCIAASGWTLFSKNNGETKTYIKCDSCQRLIWSKSFNLINATSTEATSTENGTNSVNESSNIENGVTNKIESSPTLKNGSNNESKSSSKTSIENESSEKPCKRLKLDRSDFNPLEEHRPWCRWVMNIDGSRPSLSKENQENLTPTSVPGWKLYMKSLLRNIPSPQDNSSENTPSKEHVRSVRNLLESWTSPT